jgi:8-oxo-dGTP pyrophosphatase MutT (NUDIX family)
MSSELFAAIVGGIFVLVAAILPLIWKKKEPKAVAEKTAAGLAAVIGVVQREDSILMVQRRIKYRDLSWQFPAGVVKPGEEIQDKVQDEVFNETGVHCRVKRYLGARVHDDTKVLCHYFHCTYLDGEAANRDESENSQVTWVKAGNVGKYITTSLYHEVATLLEQISKKALETKLVALGVVLNNDKVLLVQRIDDNKKPLWQLPGGTVENDESDEIAVAREIFEETGITCIPVRKLGERTHPTTRQLISYWSCDYKSGHASTREPDKFYSVLWVHREDALVLLGDDLYKPVQQALSA